MSESKRVNEPSAAPASGRGRSARFRTVLRLVFLVVALAACVIAGWRTRHGFLGALSHVSPVALLVAFVAVLAGGLVPVLGWRVLMRDLGSDLPVVATGRIYLVSQLGKYIPGSVWTVLAQVELSREFRVPARRSGAVALLTLVTATVGAVVVVVATLPFSTPRVRHDYWWVVFLLPPLLAALHPTFVRWWSRLLFRLARRGGEPVEPSARAIVASVGWMVLAWLCYGSQLYVLVVDMAGPGVATGLPTVLQTFGVFTLAWLAGFLLVFLPAGAGAREVVLVVGLASVLSPGAALAVALLSRTLTTAADLLLAAAGAGGYRLHRGRRPAELPLEQRASSSEPTLG